MTDLALRPAYARQFKADRSASASLQSGTLTADLAPRPEEWTVFVDGNAAAWLHVLVADINAAARLPRNWDSYGAEPLTYKAALHALELLQRVDFGGPAPWVAPSKDGGLHMEWTRPDVGLEIEVSEDGEVAVVLELDGEVTEWTTSVLGDPDLQSALDRVGRGR